ncbi:MAG: radical SAM protein, partial [Atopobiaceae bacterium]|nr:radical SAM protein [Atopobiaceae bacterium]
DAVRSAISDNAREVVLTGINLGRYDDGGKRLPDLLETLLERTDVGRLRLSSIEPQDVDDRLISLMASSEGRIAPYLHMCLQSGSDTVLRRMGRVYTSDEFAGRVDAAYASIPHLAIETDLIVGFPGETDAEFEESRSFCERMRFTHIHTFRYSKRPGTRAAVMDGQVPPAVSASRSESIRILGERLRFEHARSLIGSEDLVVTQAVGKGISGGLFDCTLDRPLPPDMLVRARIADAGEDATLKAVVL